MRTSKPTSTQYSPMPTKCRPRPITPAEIRITHNREVISVLSQIDNNGRLFVICPRCEKHVQLSRYGHPGNFKEHYMFKKCDQAFRCKTRKEFKKTLAEKLGPAYRGQYKSSLHLYISAERCQIPPIFATSVQLNTQRFTPSLGCSRVLLHNFIPLHRRFHRRFHRRPPPEAVSSDAQGHL